MASAAAAEWEADARKVLPMLSHRLPTDADSDHHDDGTVMAYVLSKGRESCYKARDAFYACLENHADKKPTEIAIVGLLYPADCKKSRAQYVNGYRPSWVRHFDRQHCAKKRVQKLLDADEDQQGPMSLPQPYTFKQ